MANREIVCPFCSPTDEEVFYEGELVLGIWAKYPVSKGHALLVPRRHVESWFEATPAEQTALTAQINDTAEMIAEHYRPDGFNIGINCGVVAGQTVFHLHVHVLPRYKDHEMQHSEETRHIVPSRP